MGYTECFKIYVNHDAGKEELVISRELGELGLKEIYDSGWTFDVSTGMKIRALSVVMTVDGISRYQREKKRLQKLKEAKEAKAKETEKAAEAAE